MRRIRERRKCRVDRRSVGEENKGEEEEGG